MLSDRHQQNQSEIEAVKSQILVRFGLIFVARHYKRYVRPTTKIVRGVGRFARGAGKLALRFPGTGLAATAAYYGAKHVVKKGEKVAARSATKQWHKRDNFGRTRWYL